MNSLTAIAPVITADRDALRRDFPLKPFAIRHKLAGHPLLMLPRIAQLAAELPRDLIEYNSGKVAISQDPDAIPSVDLDPVEVVKSIETAGAWMVLKRVENSPEYRRLLEDTLLSVARARGFNSLLDAGFEQVEGFLFVSSPNSTTPFHLDGNHLEDPRSAAAERFALLQFDAARHRPAAAATRQAAGARCVEARILSHRDDGDQAAARLDGDAPRAAADRARQAGELLFEGRVVAAA